MRTRTDENGEVHFEVVSDSEAPPTSALAPGNAYRIRQSLKAVAARHLARTREPREDKGLYSRMAAGIRAACRRATALGA
jgi:hypothetical protein